MILVDTREPAEMGLLLDASEVEYDKATLQSGDYVIFDKCGHSLGIERKTDTDLVHTFGTINKGTGMNRLYTQLEMLATQYDQGILLVEGLIDYDPKTGKIMVGRKQTQWNHASVQMALFACQQRYGVNVLWVASRGATVDVLRMFDERAKGGCVLRSKRENRNAAKTVNQVQASGAQPIPATVR